MSYSRVSPPRNRSRRRELLPMHLSRRLRRRTPESEMRLSRWPTERVDGAEMTTEFRVVCDGTGVIVASAVVDRQYAEALVCRRDGYHDGYPCAPHRIQSREVSQWVDVPEEQTK